MPLYEYQCENCGDIFEVMQKVSDTPLTTHEKCGGPVHRLISAPALQFKGSGWYVNDYAKGGSTSNANGSSKKEDSGSKDDSGSKASKSSSTSDSAGTSSTPTTSTGDKKSSS